MKTVQYILVLFLFSIWSALPISIFLESGALFFLVYIFSFIFDYLYFVKIPSAKKMGIFNKLKANYKMTFVLRQLYFLLFLTVNNVFSMEVLSLYVVGVILQQIAFICVQFPYEKIQKANLPFAVKNIKANAGYLKYVRSPAKYKKYAMDSCLYFELISILGLALEYGDVINYKFLFFALFVGLLGLLINALIISRRIFRSVKTGGYIESLYEQVVKKRPSIVLHFSGNSSSTYQLNTWLQVLEKLDKNVLIIVREKHHFNNINATTIPILYAGKLKDLERFVPPCAKVAFYVANVGPNLHLLRNFRLKHVFLGHGDSDKVSSMNNFTRVYDKIYVAGQAAIERYKSAGVDIEAKSFEIIGRPQLSSITVSEGLPSGKINILYAPTWEGYFKDSDYSSFLKMAPDLIEFVKANPDRYTLVIKPHPLTGLVDPLVKKQLQVTKDYVQCLTNTTWVDTETNNKSLFDCFDDSDVMITDVSSVMSDYLQSEKPLILTNPRGLQADEIHDMFPVSKSAYILNEGIESLDSLFFGLVREDRMRECRIAMKDYILSDSSDPLATFNIAVNRLYKLSIQEAGDFEVKEATENLKFEMLATSTNNGGYSKDGNIWIRSDYGYVDTDYFKVGDILQIDKTDLSVQGLSIGCYKVVDSEYSEKELDFRLKIRAIGSTEVFRGELPSRSVYFSVFDESGVPKLGVSKLQKELIEIKEKELALFDSLLKSTFTNTGGSSIGALWLKHPLSKELVNVIQGKKYINIESITNLGSYKGEATSSSLKCGKYVIGEVLYSEKERACQIKLKHDKQRNLTIAKGDVKFSIFNKGL